VNGWSQSVSSPRTRGQLAKGLVPWVTSLFDLGRTPLHETLNETSKP
jgi:hypothetical protein